MAVLPAMMPRPGCVWVLTPILQVATTKTSTTTMAATSILVPQYRPCIQHLKPSRQSLRPGMQPLRQAPGWRYMFVSCKVRIGAIASDDAHLFRTVAPDPSVWGTNLPVPQRSQMLKKYKGLGYGVGGEVWCS